MVKHWSDRVKFWIDTSFRAFRTSHQLLALAVVYRMNRGMWVWVNMKDALTVVPVLIFLLYMLLNFGTVLMDGRMNNIIILHQKPWCFSPINLRVVIFFPNAFLHFKSDICKHNRRSHVKLHNIWSYSLKRKNRMKWDENKTLCWIMRWGWMTWKQNLAFSNDDGKKLYNLFTKKI